MRKNVLVCLLAAGTLCLVSSGLYAAHTSYHCGYCHQPHRNFDPNDTPDNFGVPLFSTAQNKDPLPTYDLYSSHWFDKYGITVGQPNGATKLCLGCHDGSYKYGSGGTKSMTHVFKAADLKKSHPVSINYEEARAKGADLHDPKSTSQKTPLGGTIEQDLLDEKGYVQCSSCHDVHITGATELMLKWDAGAEWVSLCKACHNK
jgi:cytochrome c peroxidase